MTSVPRVVTGTQIVDTVIPVLTYGVAAWILTDVALQYTDQEFLLLMAAGELYWLGSMVKYFVEWLARLNDGVVDSYERYILYGVDLGRWLLFFMLPILGMSIIKWALALAALPPWYEVVALGAPVVTAILAILPTQVTTLANTAMVVVAADAVM